MNFQKFISSPKYLNKKDLLRIFKYFKTLIFSKSLKSIKKFEFSHIFRIFTNFYFSENFDFWQFWFFPHKLFFILESFEFLNILNFSKYVIICLIYLLWIWILSKTLIALFHCSIVSKCSIFSQISRFCP